MGYKILIVDDSSVTRAVLKKTIQMTGVDVSSVYEASNGSEALQRLEEHEVDLILADLNMPQMNGIEMVDKVFANPKTAEIPIIVVSTEASTARIKLLRDKGIKGYIHKPFTPESIRNVLEEVLGASC